MRCRQQNARRAANMGVVPSDIVRLVGVYDADGTALGELSYFVRARLGRAHCALCDITHGRVRERDDWRSRKATLPVPFETFHRDDQPDAVRAAGTGLPTIVAERADGTFVELVDAAALVSCAGSPERLVAVIEAALPTR
jgi:hypothetical protein